MENPIKMDDLGVPKFSDTPKCVQVPRRVKRPKSNGPKIGLNTCRAVSVPKNAGGKTSRSVRPRKIIKIKHKNKHVKSHQHKRIFPCNTAFKYANFFVVSGIGGVSGIANGTSRYNVFFTSAGSHFTIMFQHCLVEVQLVHTIPSCWNGYVFTTCLFMKRIQQLKACVISNKMLGFQPRSELIFNRTMAYILFTRQLPELSRNGKITTFLPSCSTRKKAPPQRQSLPRNPITCWEWFHGT